MEKEMVAGQVGAGGSYKVEFKGGSLRLEASYSEGVKGSVVFEIPADHVIDQIAKAIPGQLDDTILNLMKAALKLQLGKAQAPHS